MKNRESYGYRNYGSIPQNEYTTINTEKDTNAVTALGPEPQEDETTNKQPMLKRRTQHQLVGRRSSGWLHSRKVNGWRAEAASRQDEFIGAGRYSNYVR